MNATPLFFLFLFFFFLTIYFLTILEAERSKINILADLISGEDPLPGLSTATFPPCLHAEEGGGSWRSPVNFKFILDGSMVD